MHEGRCQNSELLFQNSSIEEFWKSAGDVPFSCTISFQLFAFYRNYAGGMELQRTGNYAKSCGSGHIFAFEEHSRDRGRGLVSAASFIFYGRTESDIGNMDVLFRSGGEKVGSLRACGNKHILDIAPHQEMSGARSALKISYYRINIVLN